MTSNTSIELEQRLQQRLELLGRKDRFRELRPRDGLDLSSNDYLGLAGHSYIRESMIEALRNGIPLGSTGSRLLRGNTHWHESLEQRLATFRGSEAALIFNSGFEANVGVISTLCGPGDVIFSDALIHASTIDGIRATKCEKVIFPHNDMEKLEEGLASHPKAKQKFIMVESLYSMEGDRAPLRQLDQLAKRYQAHLIVDEAHATGLFGKRRSGLLESEGVEPFISIHTCGKAWGSSGAFVACSELVKQYLINCCRNFIFTTAPPPLLTVHWNAVLDMLQREPERADQTLEMAQYFRDSVADFADTGTSTTQIVPVIMGTDANALAGSRACAEAGFDIRAIRPPTVPKGTSRLRIAFNANLDRSDVDRLVHCLRTHITGASS